MGLRGITNTDYMLSRILAKLGIVAGKETPPPAKRFRYPGEEDIVGRTWDARTISAPPLSGQMMQGNSRRWSFLVRGGSGSAFRIWPKSFDNPTQGIVVPTTGFLLFTRADYGDLLSADWQYATTIGATTFDIIEVY